MDPSRESVIWLASAALPITPAFYLERALRASHRVVTCGPKITPELWRQMHLENLKAEVPDHDFPLPFEPDMRKALAEGRERFPPPDLYVWVESLPGYFPRHLEALPCPKACYLIESHLNLQWHLAWARFFDYVFLAQREYVPAFQRQGCRNVHWLPLACDPGLHAAAPCPKDFDVGFVGTILKDTRRSQLLRQIADKKYYLKAERCFGADMAGIYARSRIGFNTAAQRDLNLRVFEIMSTGTFLLTDLAPHSGQDELFVEGEDFAVFQEQNLIERIRHHLVHEEDREQIARRGQSLVRQAHTFAHRARELLNVCWRGQPATPSASEWRERSLAGLEPASAAVSPPLPRAPQGRSFIIPVLYATAKGREEFDLLLSDLRQAGGEIIAVFNSKEAAAAFRDDPRIDLSASLNVNVGVPRAWNIGVHLATQPTLFFLNADLRIDRASVVALEEALWTLPSAAVVGPEGSFFGFYTYEDIVWFDKGCAQTPQSVDGVSGFLFATKRELFTRKILQFEDDFTPCFTEEWDLGLQVTQAGYRSYVVPVTGYDHEWGVSKSPDNVIQYGHGNRITVIELVARNRIRFWRKWLATAGEATLPPWEPNGPAAPPPTSALLQSKVVEAMQKPG